MTTYAFDGNTIAVDSREADWKTGHIITDRSKKLYVTKDYIFVAAGNSSCIQRFLTWLDKGMDENTIPKIKSLEGFIHYKDKNFVVEGSVVMPVSHGESVAGGIGWPWAKAAMAMGMNAKDAVKFASKHNIWTGGPIQSHTFNKATKSKKK